MARRCNADRREAVLSLLRREEAAGVIARRLGISEPALHRWRDEFLATGEVVLASGSGNKDTDPRDRRIAELEQQIENIKKNFRANPVEYGEPRDNYR